MGTVTSLPDYPTEDDISRVVFHELSGCKDSRGVYCRQQIMDMLRRWINRTGSKVPRFSFGFCSLIRSTRLNKKTLKDIVWYVRYKSGKNKTLKASTCFVYHPQYNISNVRAESMHVDQQVFKDVTALLHKIKEMSTPIYLPKSFAFWTSRTASEGQPMPGLHIKSEGRCFQLGKSIGRGKYGVVFDLKEAGRSTWDFVLKYEEGNDQDAFWTSSWREYAVLRLLNELLEDCSMVPKVKFWSYCDIFRDGLVQKRSTVLVMDKCKGITLYNLLTQKMEFDETAHTWVFQKNRNNNFFPLARSEKELARKGFVVRQMLRQLLDFFWSVNRERMVFVHGDMNLKNIAVCPQTCRTTLLDFGLSCIWNPSNPRFPGNIVPLHWQPVARTDCVASMSPVFDFLMFALRIGELSTSCGLALDTKKWVRCPSGYFMQNRQNLLRRRTAPIRDGTHVKDSAPYLWFCILVQDNFVNSVWSNCYHPDNSSMGIYFGIQKDPVLSKLTLDHIYQMFETLDSPSRLGQVSTLFDLFVVGDGPQEVKETTKPQKREREEAGVRH